jgi:hypothetical protein
MLDGFCDGAGACRTYAAGTQCAAAVCASGAATARRICNGAGACAAAAPSSCAPYVCAGATCATSCAVASDCQTPNICTAGRCVPPCAAQFNFEDGTAQGWAANAYAARAFSALVNDGTHTSCGGGALQATATFGTENVGEMTAPLGAATTFTGKTVTFHLYIAGPALPSGAALQGLLINAGTYSPGGYTQSIAAGQWNVVSFSPSVTADRVGVQLLLPSGATWTGTVWLDEVGW